MFRVDISKKMKFYLKKKHKQFQDYREKMLPKLLKCILSLLIGIVIGELATEYLTSTRTITITNAVAVQSVEASAPVVSEVSASAKVEQSGEQSPTASEIEKMIIAEFPNDKEMLSIAKAESRLNPKAHNKNNNGSIDTGIFQINSIHGYDEKWLQDPKNNIEAAKEILKKQGKTAWVTYNYSKQHNKPI